MERKIIGYKCPRPLFNGSIAPGTEYRKTEEGNHWYAPYSLYNEEEWEERISRNYLQFGQCLPKEIVEEWEPVYEESAFKAGDWVIGWHRRDMEMNKQAWQIEKLEEGDRDNVFVFVKGTKGYNTDISNIRKATPEEIKEVTEYWIDGYKAVFNPDKTKVTFGCQTYDKSTVLQLNQLFASISMLRVEIYGVPVTKDDVTKLLRFMQ